MRDPDATPAGATRAIGRLKRRADFVRVGKGRRWHGKALTLQVAATAGEGDPAEPRVGFTLTRKVGNAVIRNRARRRLKEALRLAPALPLEPGHDYVIIGRIDAILQPFEALKTELAHAIGGVHAAREGSRHRGGDRRNRTRQKP